MVERCNWPGDIPEMIKYHDEEWGVPIDDNRKIFEFLILDIFQAGLSWKTILLKRESFRVAFDNFDYRKIKKYNETDTIRLLENSGIIRNKQKITAAIHNAGLIEPLLNEFGSLWKYFVSFNSGIQVVNEIQSMNDIPTKSELSDNITSDMKKRGFKFVGSTIIYAFLQSIGIINDHKIQCFRYKDCLLEQDS